LYITSSCGSGREPAPCGRRSPRSTKPRHHVGAVLTDNGREFCGKPESHPYELLLSVEGIKHRTTKVRSPRTNGLLERMNRTLLDECFRVQGRTNWYDCPDQIQRDLDTFMAFYNFQRTHQGYRVAGRTPAKALYDLIASPKAPATHFRSGRGGAARQPTDLTPEDRVSGKYSTCTSRPSRIRQEPCHGDIQLLWEGPRRTTHHRACIGYTPNLPLTDSKFPFLS
jgi:hypothetical protein